MPEDSQSPPPPQPRPVIPIESDPDEVIDAQILGDGPAAPAPPPVPVMPIAEPGVVPPAPFAQVYAPPPTPPPAAYYPPAYPAYAPPVNPPAWPDPVDYRSSMVRSYSRPGIITAMAVTAIIVAALSMITTIFTGCTSAVIKNNSRGSAGTVRTTVSKPGIIVNTVKPSSPNALSDSDNIAVVHALTLRRPLSEPRREQLKNFLAENGKLVFDDSDVGLTSNKVTARLGQAGTEFSNGKSGPEYFVITAGKGVKLPGRLRLFDDRAVFKPDDYSPDLRSEGKPEDPSAAVIPQSNITDGLEDDQIRAVIGQIKAQSNNNLNAAQSATLTSLLQTPAYANWLQNSSTVAGLTAQVKSAAVADDGSVIITFTMAKLTLDPQGNRVGPMPVAPAPAVAATQPVNPFATGWAAGTLRVDQTSCSLGLVDAVISGLLAIYLLVIAILSLKRNPIGRKFYFIYIAAKIAIGVVAVAAFSGIINSLNATSAPGGFSIAQSASQFFAGIASAALTFSVIGLAYPVVIMLVLVLSKTARDYYRSAN